MNRGGERGGGAEPAKCGEHQLVSTMATVAPWPQRFHVMEFGIRNGHPYGTRYDTQHATAVPHSSTVLRYAVDGKVNGRP